MPTLEQIITEAERLAHDDKAIAYHYLIGVLRRAAGLPPDATRPPSPPKR